MKTKQLKSWNQYHCYKGLFRSHATTKKRLLIIQTCILSVQLWLSETWKPTERILSSLRGFHHALMRAAIPLPKSEHEGEHKNITHARWALKQLQAPLADALFLRRYFRWAGHIARSRDRHVGKVFLFRDHYWWELQQTLREGYRHTVQNAHLYTWEQPLVQTLGAGWKDSAKNRERWQKLCPLFIEHHKKNSALKEDIKNKKKVLQVPQKVSTVEVNHRPPMVTPRESTRAKKFPLKQDTPPLVTQKECTMARDSSPLEHHIEELGKDIEAAQRAARKKRIRESSGNFARHEGVLKRIQTDENHTPGSLAEAGHDLWRPLPFERRKHRKRKIEDSGKDTLLCDIPALLAAGQGHGGLRPAASEDRSRR